MCPFKKKSDFWGIWLESCARVLRQLQNIIQLSFVISFFLKMTLTSQNNQRDFAQIRRYNFESHVTNLDHDDIATFFTICHQCFQISSSCISSIFTYWKIRVSYYAFHSSYQWFAMQNMMTYEKYLFVYDQIIFYLRQIIISNNGDDKQKNHQWRVFLTLIT